jgi:hypothetical protein
MLPVPDHGIAMPAKIVTTANIARNRAAPVAFAGKRKMALLSQPDKESHSNNKKENSIL